MVRLHGRLSDLPGPALDINRCQKLIWSLLTAQQQEDYEQHQHLDICVNIGQHGRFRINVFHHLHGIGAVIRVLNSEVQTLDMLGLPNAVRDLTQHKHGLVLGTMHTNSAPDSVDRIIDVFPAEEQAQVRVQLAETLVGIVSQVLLPRCDQPGRVPATEVLIGSQAVSSIIREGKSQELASVIQGGRGRGMHTLDDSLSELVRTELVSHRDARMHARNKGRFDKSPYLAMH